MDLSGQLHGRAALSQAKSPSTQGAKGSNQYAWTFKHRSGRGLCVGLITRPEESYRPWCVCVWWRILDNKTALAQ